MIQNPIFILGTERSGSNLLRLILHSHSHIAVPHPPHIVRYFAPLERGYGDLRTEPSFRRLVRDVMKLLDVHIYPWDVPIDVERVVHTAPERSAFGICVALYEQYREHAGKPRWACKSTFMIDHTHAILHHFPAAKLILLVRDPRDVAVSSRQSVFSTFHPYFTARLWHDQQTTGIHLLDTLPQKTILLVRYEDLVRRARPEVERICEFLSEAFEPAMLRYFDTSEARKSAALSESWRNTGKPILENNTDKFTRELSDEEILLVESVARLPMTRFGYTPMHSPAMLDTVHIERGRYAELWLKERLLRLGVELRSATSDRNAGRRWRRDALMMLFALRRGLWPSWDLSSETDGS